MVDFATLTHGRSPRLDYSYTCDRCKRRQIMRLKLPAHLRACTEPHIDRPGVDCGGTLHPEEPTPREEVPP